MDDFELRALINEAIAALEAGDYVRAIAMGDQLAAEAPDRAVVRAIRAQALLGADSPQESLREAHRAVELDPDDEFAQRLLAHAAWRNEQLGLAQQSFEKALELSERRPDVLAEYAWFMANERGPKPAESIAHEAVVAAPDSSTAWAALGLAHFRLHRTIEANECLRHALELNPNDLYAQSAMIALLHDCRQDERADALVDLLQKSPGTEEVVSVVRDESKRRQVERMLVERKVEVGGLPPEPPNHGWVWIMAAATLVGVLFSMFGGVYLAMILVIAAIFVVLLWRLLG